MSITYTIGGELRTRPILPDAAAVRIDGPGEASAENQPLPETLARQNEADKSPARWAYERLILYIQNFESQLDRDQEVVMGFAGSDSGTLRIGGMGYFAPDIVTFYGMDTDGAKTQLVQHVSQLNVILKAMPKENSEPRRIGFALRDEMMRQAEAEGEEPRRRNYADAVADAPEDQS